MLQQNLVGEGHDQITIHTHNAQNGIPEMLIELVVCSLKITRSCNKSYMYRIVMHDCSCNGLTHLIQSEIGM